MVLLLPALYFLALMGGVALVASGPADRCLMLDGCYFKTEAKTCSCQPDCHLYGTCCLGVEGAEGPAAFRCHGRNTHDPLFVRRSCKPDYRGHPHDKVDCVDDDDVDEADVVNNLLVTNRLTKVTYWNRKCAKCNDEDMKNLEFWDIVVQCEARQGVDARSIRRHLAYDPDRLRWGVRAAGGEDFVPCLVRYSPPASLEEVKYCNPNVTHTCPPDYPDRERVRKCSYESYAERKLKNADVYFRNIHCAICNGIDEKDVECPGMAAGPEDSADESDFRDVTEVVFSGGEWLVREPGRQFECSPGYVYDPFRGRCRTSGTEGGRDVVLNSAPLCSGMSYLLLATLSAALIL